MRRAVLLWQRADRYGAGAAVAAGEHVHRPLHAQGARRRSQRRACVPHVGARPAAVVPRPGCGVCSGASPPGGAAQGAAAHPSRCMQRMRGLFGRPSRRRRGCGPPRSPPPLRWPLAAAASRAPLAAHSGTARLTARERRRRAGALQPPPPTGGSAAVPLRVVAAAAPAPPRRRQLVQSGAAPTPRLGWCAGAVDAPHRCQKRLQHGPRGLLVGPRRMGWTSHGACAARSCVSHTHLTPGRRAARAQTRAAAVWLRAMPDVPVVSSAPLRRRATGSQRRAWCHERGGARRAQISRRMRRGRRGASGQGAPAPLRRAGRQEGGRSAPLPV